MQVGKFFMTEKDKNDNMHVWCLLNVCVGRKNLITVLIAVQNDLKQAFGMFFH